ncbi:MAG: hypothetical protein SPL10_06555 [Synergistales bacterium]|nr:hypothetical protein [Synergistales bacterium]MDY6401879.1 hypothetical protein [Synergistales bacterium]MDY6403893.1 hypothetical protein [Synergistales bacterium]MDY6409885.1 hypothetical protein [Synergistales bacterium]MDY6414801.1 hypothetical protein [Synergistales bacterium]
MPNEKGRRSKKPKKKQRRIPWQKVYHIAAALYWFVRLFLLLWDRFAN